MGLMLPVGGFELFGAGALTIVGAAAAVLGLFDDGAAEVFGRLDGAAAAECGLAAGDLTRWTIGL